MHADTEPTPTSSARPLVGLALGSGAARGWSHIGVLEELARLGIAPDIICGSSVGAAVGAAYAAGRLETLDAWARRLDRRKVWRYLDVKLVTGGGFLEGRRLMDYFRERMGDILIEKLAKPFAAVATDLVTGREVWFRQGSVLDAVRASIAIPGIFVPVKLDGRWLVDGGLANPVPVSLCRAMGADVVIAVNLNGDILSRHREVIAFAGKTNGNGNGHSAEATLLSKWARSKNGAASFMAQWFKPNEPTPGLFNVLSASLNIMQDHITRSRMAGDPPEVVLAPRLANIGLLDFDRAKDAIEEGRACVHRALPALEDALRLAPSEKIVP
jgi:NTE family protein